MNESLAGIAWAFAVILGTIGVAIAGALVVEHVVTIIKKK